MTKRNSVATDPVSTLNAGKYPLRPLPLHLWGFALAGNIDANSTVIVPTNNSLIGLQLQFQKPEKLKHLCIICFMAFS
jgi:hypothetical protein